MCLRRSEAEATKKKRIKGVLNKARKSIVLRSSCLLPCKPERDKLEPSITLNGLLTCITCFVERD